MSEDNQQKLLNFAYTCDAVRKKLHFSTTALTPLNLEEEKRKFFNSSTYNPLFYYRSNDFKQTGLMLQELKLRIKELKLPREVRLYLEEYLQDLQLVEKTKKSIGTDEFGYYAEKLFHYHEIQKFHEPLHYPNCIKDEQPGKTLYTADEIAAEFKNSLINDYGLTDYEVCIETNKSNIIWTGRNSIHIGQSIKRYDKNVHRLIVHEIESHALQFHNLSLYHNPLTMLSKYRELNLYSEGLAVYNEIKTGTITKKAYDDYWYRLKAVQMLEYSFREIYEYLRENLSEKRAFQITYRVKRGMKHTAKPGGFPKDASYYLGYKTIKNYLESGLQHEFLYISKNPNLSALLLRYNLLKKENLVLPGFLQSKPKTFPTTIPQGLY